MNRLIYIVEDDSAIKELESYALINSDFSVYAFERAKELYNALNEKIPALILLDIMLPEEDGISILKNIRKNNRYKDIPVILVTAKTTEIDAVKGLDAGADDYISKPFGVMELVSRVKAVLRRTQKSQILQTLTYKNITIDEAQHKVFVDNNEIELTFKEYEVLKLLILNNGIVMTRDKIMEKIWGYDFEQGNRTVDVHIQSIRKKLGNSGSYIKTIRNVGYKTGN